MNSELTECYRILGLKPGASAADVKAAHRDLAKVWHPDRFLHDLRLQQKAQEKLKEINEAYDQLSGKTKRKIPAAPVRDFNTDKPERIRWRLIFAPVLIFAAVFLVASQLLLRTVEPVDQSLVPAIKQAQDPSQPEHAGELQPTKDQNGLRSQRKETDVALTGESDASVVRPIPTVTVTIDPTSGMIARPWCPVKTSMTYPSGNEPHEYCSSHRTAPVPPLEKIDASGSKESRMKSVAKRLLPR